jgi:phosphopantetheinyl transferase (holo-ACP synthase)
MLRELAYQTAGAYELFGQKWLALPKGEGRLKFYRDAPPEAAVRAIARFKELRDNVAHFDVQVATTEGDLLFEVHDFQLIRLRPDDGGNGQAASPAPPQAPAVYRSRWGHDLPLPVQDVVGVRIERGEVEAMAVDPGEALTGGERADQERYRNDKRAREFFLGRLAAKEAIAQVVGRPIKEARGIDIRRLETGEPRPRGSGMDDVLVTITHTGDTAMAAAARRGPDLHTIGLDAELIEPKAPAFETEAFADGERRLLDRLETAGTSRAEAQVRFWAVKEAVLKALGKGFALALHDVQIQDLDADERVQVQLREPAQAVLRELGASHVGVQTWVRDGLAFALAWTRT